jgi:hypothetical protein
MEIQNISVNFSWPFGSYLFTFLVLGFYTFSFRVIIDYGNTEGSAGNEFLTFLCYVPLLGL